MCVAPGKLLEEVRRASRRKLSVGRKHSHGGDTMSEGGEERSSLLGAGGLRTLVAVGMRRA